jgi:uncharacterized protein YwqG
MDLPSAITAIRSSPLQSQADALISTLRPSIRIRTARDPSVAMKAVSRFSGQPMLPQGMPWPTWNSSAYYQRDLARAEEALLKGTGDLAFHRQQADLCRREAAITSRPLHFFAMIRLNELPPGTHDIGLPDRGTLLFFYDVATSPAGYIPQSRGSARVILVREDETLVAAAPPDDVRTDFAPSRLSFESEYTLPQVLGYTYKTPYGDLLEKFSGEPPYHRIGGNPEEVQNGLFRACQLAFNNVEAGTPEALSMPEVQELALGAADWRLLLQLDTDDDGPGWMFGDSGTLYFCIRNDDLLAERFEHIWCDEQYC